MSEQRDGCLMCGGDIDRTLPEPLPEGYECMGTEALAGRALYCRKCYERAHRRPCG